MTNPEKGVFKMRFAKIDYKATKALRLFLIFFFEKAIKHSTTTKSHLVQDLLI